MPFESPFQDVPARVRPDRCISCHGLFAKAQRVTQVWIVAGVDRHPGGSGLVPFLCDVPEFAHASCDDAALTDAPRIIIEFPRPRVKSNDIVSLRPRTNEYTCTLCRKRVVRGDRVICAMIVEGIDIDPQTKSPAAKVSGEYEVVHFRCNDPQLDMGSAPLIVNSQ